ncbi:MAG: helix-turn-helix transcriptional regulator [Clostridium sp.]|nr:helix-turn-helix transcriptional regulator [Clostridium sp.]
MEKLQISLAAARVNAGLTQADVAEKMGVSRQTVINWESGKISTLGIPEMKMLCEIYSIPQDNIFLPSNSTKSRN